MPITEYCESTLIIKDKSEDEFPVSGKGHPHYLESPYQNELTCAFWALISQNS